jgi:hypothetical protein
VYETIFSTTKRIEMNSILTNVFGKSWRTALAGWSKGVVVAATTVAEAAMAGKFNFLHGAALVYAVLTVAGGAVAKDAKTTGLPNDPIVIPEKTKLQIAQDALTEAKKTGNQFLIVMCEAEVNGITNGMKSVIAAD